MRQTCFTREEPIEVIHLTEGAFNYDTGECDPSTEQPGEITGSIQPIPGKVLERLPEGRRSRAVMALWTRTALEAGNTLVIYKGYRFEVDTVQDWDQPSSPLPHYMYVLLREGNHGHEVDGGFGAQS